VKPHGECEIAPGECVFGRIVRLACWNQTLPKLGDGILESGREE